MTKTTLVLLVSALAASSVAQSPDPKEIWASIVQIRSDAAEQSKKGVKVDRAEVERQVAAKVRQEVSKIDLSKIDAKDADGWAQLCEAAGMFPEAETLADKAVRYHAMSAFQAQSSLFHAYLEQGKTKEFLGSIRNVMAVDSSMIGQLGESVHYFGARYAKSNPQLLFDAYDALLGRIDLTHPATNRVDQQYREYAYVDLCAKKLELLADTGKRKEAIAGLKALKARFASSTSKNAFGQSPTFRIDELLGRWEMVSKGAPPIVFDRTLGGFKGLESLKGKVVLVDFFAHWCGPCKAAFPEIRENYAKYRDKGLAVVGVTSYYGYIGSRQGLKPEDEYEAMKGFVKDQQMTWPVAFDPKQSSFRTYQVGPIPHMVVIDRKGNIRKIVVGYEPVRAAETRELIEKLLSES